MNIPARPCPVVELSSAFRVNDASGQAVAYVYFAEGSRLTAMGMSGRGGKRESLPNGSRGALTDRVPPGCEKITEIYHSPDGDPLVRRFGETVKSSCTSSTETS